MKRDYKLFLYYEEIKRKLKRMPIYECRCNERQKAKSEESTRLTYTGLCEALENLKIETRLRDERFESVKGVCYLETIGVSSTLKLIRNAASLTRMLSTLDLNCVRKR
jgi:hypothetical protein